MWYKPELTRVEQLSQQQATSNQNGELTVSFSPIMSSNRVNEAPGSASLSLIRS